jgi:DNA-directed RNA polymerase subunit RPC12/RpoP
MLGAAISDGTVLSCRVDGGGEDLTPRVLGRHPKGAQCVAFSSDGAALASGGSDDHPDRRDVTLILWDPQLRGSALSLTGHEVAVQSVAFSPGGQVLAAGDIGGVIGLWALSPPREQQVLKGKGLSIASLAFSPDGRFLASGVGGYPHGAIELWGFAGDGPEGGPDPASGRQVHRGRLVSAPVSRAAEVPGSQVRFGVGAEVECPHCGHRFYTEMLGLENVCAQCGGRFEVDDDGMTLGEAVECPHCGYRFCTELLEPDGECPRCGGALELEDWGRSLW